MKLLQAHGKLLISAEYMVLHGSKALAVPLTRGQTLQRIPSGNRSEFLWTAYFEGNTWFRATFDSSTLRIKETTDLEKAEILRNLIKACIKLDASFQRDLFTWDVETTLEFSPSWGFGSSSTLIALMADWAELNPLDLHFTISEGSGYDVACAISEGPIEYRLRNYVPQYQRVMFDPPFADHLYFVWLGSKQVTAAHLTKMAGKINPGYELIHLFSKLTESMIEASELSSFQEMMVEHEERLSELLGIEKVSVTRFQGLPGTVKSLGAWGGDFVMIASDREERELYNYLDKIGIEVIFKYKEIVYNGGA